MNERRIATVLRVRALHERIARGDVARSRRELASELSAEAAAWDLVRESSVGAMPSAGSFVAHRGMLRAGVTDATAAGHQVTEARHDVSAAITNWQDQARRRDGIERLLDRMYTEARAAEQRTESKELDDLVVMRRTGRRIE